MRGRLSIKGCLSITKGAYGESVFDTATKKPPYFRPSLVRGYSAQVSFVQRLLATYLIKSLPTHLRLVLKTLSPRERLEFQPIGERESIIDLLRQVPLGGRIPHLESLADFFSFAG